MTSVCMRSLAAATVAGALGSSACHRPAAGRPEVWSVAAEAIESGARVEAPGSSSVAAADRAVDGSPDGPGPVVPVAAGAAPAAPPAAEPIPASPATPPPLRGTRALPVIPDLPSPGQVRGALALPRRADITSCGEVWTPSGYTALGCFDPDARVGRSVTAKVVVPYDRMRPAPHAIPALVDHRSDALEGPVRDQSRMPACTAMALTAALDHSFARWTGSPGAFSVMQVWARYHDADAQLQTVPSHRRQEAVAADYNLGVLLGNEEDWPYDPREARTMTSCPKDPEPDALCGKGPSPGKLAYLDSRPVARVTQMEVIGSGQVDVLREKLAAGQDVAVAIRVPSSFGVSGEPGSRYWAPRSVEWNGKYKGSHQVLLAGYAVTSHGTFYLVHNSLGVGWGDQGYAWLYEDYLRAYSSDDVMVIPDVEPLRVEVGRLDPRGHPRAACAGGSALDSISGACAARCADGSPRHDGACADADHQDCLAGFVNLVGACTLAAPRGTGALAGQGVEWACGAGGCAYTIAGGRLGCEAATCGVSCPAPTFRLATTPTTLVCVE